MLFFIYACIEQCEDETAYHYDEDGKALCSDCLIMNHLDGKYDQNTEGVLKM